MALKDISWGAVVVGAAAVTALVAISFPTALGAIAGTIAGMGLSSTAAMSVAVGGTAVAGGIAGEFVSDLLSRTRDACNTLIRPR